MRIKSIFTHPKFDKHYKKLSGQIGEEKECWAFDIGYRYRIKFIFLSDEEVLFLDIGTHNIYK